MSVSSLFCPNNNVIYASEFISDAPNNPGNVPAMTASTQANVAISLGAISGSNITAGLCRSDAMVITGSNGNTGVNTIDFITVIAQNPLNPAQQLIQVTVHLPSLLLTTVTGTATPRLNYGTIDQAIIPIGLRPASADIGFAIMCEDPVGTALPALLAIRSSGAIQINLINAGTPIVNGFRTEGDIVVTYTIALS